MQVKFSVLFSFKDTEKENWSILDTGARKNGDKDSVTHPFYKHLFHVLSVSDTVLDPGKMELNKMIY